MRVSGDRLYILSQNDVARALEDFRTITLTEHENGDCVFVKHGPGNTREDADRPFERFSDYESLLTAFREDDEEKYNKIHKGTPFFFLAYTGYDLNNFEKALFYLDAAITEDIRAGGEWRTLPAGQLLTLKWPTAQVAKRVTKRIRSDLETEIERFNKTSQCIGIKLDCLIRHFVEKLIDGEAKHRGIVTAFYTFLIEFEERCRELRLRGSGGGSLEPFVVHLFKGGLILESLLKFLYPKRRDGKPTETLDQVFKTEDFRNDFVQKVKTSARTLQAVHECIKNQSDLPTALNVTAQLRNTTGHNLVWDDIFTEDVYKALVEQELNAALYVISKKFVPEAVGAMSG